MNGAWARMLGNWFSERYLLCSYITCKGIRSLLVDMSDNDNITSLVRQGDFFLLNHSDTTVCCYDSMSSQVDRGRCVKHNMTCHASNTQEDIYIAGFVSWWPPNVSVPITIRWPCPVAFHYVLQGLEACKILCQPHGYLFQKCRGALTSAQMENRTQLAIHLQIWGPQ